MNEKEKIEKATADTFIKLYNGKTNSSFSIVKYSDAPDIRCKDRNNEQFNFEITLTEDRPKDIQARLGRSNHKSKESLEKHLIEVKSGKAHPLDRVSCLNGNVKEVIISRITKKLNKDYGDNVALVIRDSSPMEWEWDEIKNDIVSKLDLERNPFDKGIWIITLSKDKIYRIL